MNIELPELATTVVGSFPSTPPVDALFKYCRDGQDPFHESLENAVEAQISAGIQIVSDGQTRNDMVKLFTTKLSGIRMRSKPVVIKEIGYKGPITVQDQKLAKQIIGDRALLKGIITGPFTLAMSCQDDFYGSMEKLAMGFAEALNKEARQLSEIVDILQIDEPFFSVEYPEYAGQLISTIFSGVKIPKAMHVCGDVGQIFSQLVELPVDILDHEFSAHPELMDIVSDIDFTQHIGFGCVRSDVNEVESIEIISERIKKGIDCVGQSRLLLDPDCGLRHLPPEVAKSKLENMVKARNVVIGNES
ncbi:MAG: methionine synthase [Thermoplasmata archaeon]|nr:methionine synthase [Thermoplasmata archaeon]